MLLRNSRGSALLAIVLIAILGASLAGAFSVWRAVDVELGFHGWLAIALGVGVSVALGVGLMMLSFHSARAGWDDLHRPETLDDREHKD